MIRVVTIAAAAIVVLSVPDGPADARTCTQIRALCWTMRANDADCTIPYRRCLKTGIFITPLGRRFKATTK